MLTTHKLQMKGEQRKETTATQPNGNLGHLHHIVVEAALFKCQQGTREAPTPPPTAPAKIRQIKHYYSRHSRSWPFKWFYVNYHNGLL